MVVVGSPLGSMIHQPWLVGWVSHISLTSLLMSNLQAQLESCLLLPKCICHYCTLTVITLFWLLCILDIIAGRDVDCFLPCMVPSCSMKAVLRREFMSIASQWLLGPVSEVQGVFINRDLTFTSGRQAKAIAAVCNLGGVSCTMLKTNPKRAFNFCCWDFC